MDKRTLWWICIFAFLASCQNSTSNSSAPQEPQAATAPVAQNITYEIINVKDNTYGYEISVNGKKLIHQEHIPAVSGTLGFKTAEQAQKVAEFLIEKMKKGESLPAISPTELNQLGAL